MGKMTQDDRREFSLRYETAKKTVMVKVHNNDSEPYQEPYQDQLIYIPAHSFILMPYSNAMDFKSKGPHSDGKGGMKIKALKVDSPTVTEVKLHMTSKGGINDFYSIDEEEVVTEVVKEVVKEVECPICNQICKSSAGLMVHLRTHKPKTVKEG